MTEPYKTTPLFDECSLPAAIRSNHSTKEGVWGLLRVLEGSVRLHFAEPPKSVFVDPDHPALITPQAVHHVEVTGPMKCRVEFYHEMPTIA